MARAQTTSFATYVQPGFRKIFFEPLGTFPKQFRQVLRIIPPVPSERSGLHYFDDLQISSLGTLVPKAEGDSIQYQRPIEGSTVRYQPYTFASGFRITLEMKQDDLYGPMGRMTRELSKAALHQMEVQGWRPINNGFSTTGGTGHTAAGFDTQAAFALSHTLLNPNGAAPPTSSYARSTRAATDEDLSETAVEHAKDKMKLWVNHSNMPEPKGVNGGIVLVIPPQLEWIAKQIMPSPEQRLMPYTGNNEVNPLGGEVDRYMVCYWLNDDDSWFLLPPKEEHDFNVWMRMEPQFEMGDDFDSKDTKASAVFRMASGHGEVAGFGSLGA